MRGFGQSSKGDSCYKVKEIASATPDKEGPFPDVRGGAQGDYTKGSVRGGAPEAGSKLPKGRGYGAAKRG
jgi:hypothetical protein